MMNDNPGPIDPPATLDLKASLGVGRTAEVFAWGEGRVLKLFRPGWRMEVAQRELAVARAIYDAGVPSPRPDEAIEVAGRAGVVYERISGPSLLALLLARPWRWGANARTLGETHAAIHAAPAPDLLPLGEALGRAIRAAPGLPEADRAAALGALDALVASTGAVALCHGDYHPDNVLLDPRGPKVIDWENATIGDPAADVARTLLLVRSSEASIPSRGGRLVRRALGALLIALYLRAYRHKRSLDRARLAAWELPITAARLSEGITEEREYLLARVRRLAARG
jgi:aminoglycoside phosphotransferase (APT) family kinase protein